MKKIKPKAKRLIAYGILLFVCAVLVIPVCSWLAKYLLEKHDLEWLGRKVTVDWVYVNPYTGYIRLSNVKIFEEQGDSLFIAAESANANFFLPKLFNRTVEMTQLIINRPWAIVVQNKDTLNFDDLVRLFTPDSVPSGNPWHVTLLTTKIIGGEFHYKEKIIPINYFIRDVNIESTGKERYVDTIAAKFYLREGKSDGDMKGNFTINMKNYDYRIDLGVHDFNLEIIRQYIWELINYGMFRAHLNAQIVASGNLLSQENVTAKGRVALNDFHLGKTNEEDYFAFKNLTVGMQEFSPANHIYHFDSITLTDPYLVYEVYDSLDNVEALFGKAGKNITDVTSQAGRFNLVIEIARYMKVLSQNFFNSQYKIGNLGVYNGSFIFNDYSLNEKFSTKLSPLSIRADSVNNNHKRVEVTAQSRVRPYGNLKLFLSINPKDSGDFDMTYNIEKIPASTFNPYLISYTSFPLDRGTIELNGWWKVRGGEIKSDNHLVLLDPRVTRKVKNKNTKSVPLPLIMSFIREKGNVIDYMIPITGNLKNPKFHLKDVILDLIKNIFVKPPSAPYREEIRQVETEIEKSLNVKWEMRQYALWPSQEKFIEKISKFLKDHPDASMMVHPLEYTSREKEYILFFETKKKYFLINHHKARIDFNEADSLEVSKMSIKDVKLIKYLGKNLSDTVMFTVQERCINFVGHKVVDASFKKLMKAREASFRSQFIKDGTEQQIKMYQSKGGTPYNGFSQFVLSYPGEMPDALHNAYLKMIKLNEEEPRKKYLKERKKLIESSP